MTDDELLDDLRRSLEAAEPIPPESTVLAQAAFGWRTMDAELAELVHDSSIDPAELVVRASDPGQRVLSFATESVQIDVEFANGQLVGQVAPPEPAAVELRCGEDPPLTAETDEFGAFVIDGAGRGPAALMCRALDGTWSVRTSWTNL